MSPIEKLDYKLIWYEREIKTTANVTRKDVKEFLELAEKAKIQPEVKIYDLTDANEALKDLKYGRVKGQIVLKT